jgi:hypothetical protein
MRRSRNANIGGSSRREVIGAPARRDRRRNSSRRSSSSNAATPALAVPALHRRLRTPLASISTFENLRSRLVHAFHWPTIGRSPPWSSRIGAHPGDGVPLGRRGRPEPAGIARNLLRSCARHAVQRLQHVLKLGATRVQFAIPVNQGSSQPSSRRSPQPRKDQT